MTGTVQLTLRLWILRIVKDKLDHETFAALFESARPSLRVIAGAECGFAHADDAVQQAAVIAMRKLASFTPGTDFNAWCAAIVRGAARNTRRSEKRHANRARRAARSGSLGTAPHDTLDHEIHDEKLRGALDTLTSDQRCCLLLKTTQGKSYKQIGAMLGIPETTARSHAHRARSALLERMTPKEGGAP